MSDLTKRSANITDWPTSYGTHCWRGDHLPAILRIISHWRWAHTIEDISINWTEDDGYVVMAVYDDHDERLQQES